MNETGYKMNDDHASTSRRSHLTKDERMPRCYKDTEKIIKSVQSCQNNFKTVMANSRFRGAHFKKVYNLSLNVLKYYNYIQKIIDKTEMLTKERFLRREIASILIYELIYGKGYIPGESKVVMIVQAYESNIFKFHQELQNGTDACEISGIYVPRYVRVHTLKTTVAYVIKDLETYGFKQIVYEEDISEEKYLVLVRSLERGAFFVDFHFKDILVFAQDENLIELDLYKNGHIFLQDKASYIPVHVLNPEPGSTVLDACAAPGMKSAHIASKMENKGTLIACERDTKRFEILKETLEYGSVKMAKTLCTDFKLVDPNDEAYASVEYILLDPSCSGSGMVNRMDEVTNNEDSTSKERIQKLAGFQIILLKHALKFPSVKRVVYSTCSIHEEENEYVVHEVLNAFGHSFKLVPVLPGYFSRGSQNYQYGEMCLRTDPAKHLTNGFFVAVFERKESHESKDKYSKKYKKFKSSRDDSKKVYSRDKRSAIGYCPDRKTEVMTSFKQEKETCEFRELNENIENSMLNHFDGKGKFERCIKKEESCEYKELNETVKDSLNEEDGCKVKDYHLSNFEDAKVENITKSKSHKKSKKSKYSEHTDTEANKEQEINTHHYKAGKQQRNDFSDLCPEGDRTRVVQSPTACQMSSELDNMVLERKKSKHKKSRRSGENFDVTEKSSELISEHKRKKKKRRKHSEMSLSDINSLEEQNNDTNSDAFQISESTDNPNKNNIENATDFNAGDDKNLPTSSPKKHKKKKKKKEHEVKECLDICNVNPLETVQKSAQSKEIVNFSYQENSGHLQTEDKTRNTHFEDNSNDLKQTKSKKHKHKKHGRKSDCDILTESLDNSFPVTEDKTGNTHFDDNSNDLKQTKSKKHKHKKHARKSDCDILTESLDNSLPVMMKKETNFEDSESTLANIPNEGYFHDKKRSKRKSKKDNSLMNV